MRSDSAPPDILFFSLEPDFRCTRFMMERRLRLLLLTVILRVAHRDRCVLSFDLGLSPFASDAMMGDCRY